jgi:hypothetical protein
VRFVYDAEGDRERGGRSQQAGPDAFELIQAYEDHFSCSVEWMKLAKEGIFRRRRARRRQAPIPKAPSD